MTFQYEKNPDKIYEQSFSIIRKEAELSSFSNLEEKIAVRMIHALGFVGLEKHIQFTPGFVSRVRDALEKGSRIICDTKMVSEGITKARLPANNQIICTLNEKSVPEIAKRISNTRTAAPIHPYLVAALSASSFVLYRPGIIFSFLIFDIFSEWP